ncbi:hypothetical protein CSA17_04485 [bacterium DOLJORAL78_65_58]|nr:MAG: hypothetical protein CSB20_08185 [bacterium DOLZORAL124_64_63]PIE76009.1 MAG: hypothetical protein CSA17_04485 [bacterium DOLJORAL78_65_58]
MKDRLWSFLAGFLLSVNIYVLPFLPTSPRGTDAAALLLGLWILGRLVRRRQPPWPLSLALLAGLIPLIWLFFNILGKDQTTALASARWLVAVPWAVALAALFRHEERSLDFARGLFVGGLVNVAVIVLQWLGLESILVLLGLSPSDASFHHFVFHQVRLPGLHGHHNSSSAVLSLMVPAGFVLYFRKRMGAPALFGGLLAMMLALHLTSTRSPLIIAILTVAFVTAQARRMRQGVMIGIFMLSILLPLLMVYGPPGGWARWKNKEALISNATERQDSGRGALELCLEYPLGLGVEKSHQELDSATGIKAAHNAFLQAALTWGLPFGFFVLLAYGVLIVRSFGGIAGGLFLPGALAFHTAGLFMFEEHLNNPTFVILTLFVMTAAYLRSGRSPADSPADNPS